MFRCSNPPELLPEFARGAERLGFDELWVVEDCFYPAAISTAATALASTSRITVGIGVLPAVLRNAALAAMELSGLASIFPGRVLAGFGHGVADWMRQVGAFPDSQLAALDETVAAVRALLAGDTVTTSGRHVRLRDVRLEFPPADPVPIFTGVRGPKSLRLSGGVADGTILAELTGPATLSWARTHIDAGRSAAGRIDDHRVTVYTLLETDDDRQATRALAAGALLGGGPPAGIDADLAQQIRQLAGAADGRERLAEQLPDAYLDQLCVSGPAEQCAAGIGALHQAGADAVVLVPATDPELADRQLAQVAGEVLPLLR
jgi:alkanesulfonate monooxygenase SsuD/methylene tetrahydromethanopterin reductase-like flavin-dependent oxidoreductase (luciferase family)